MILCLFGQDDMLCKAGCSVVSVDVMLDRDMGKVM
jgi:hypothetical protein